MKPIIKWAGGKTQLLQQLESRMPKDIQGIIEPFAGGLALSLDLQPQRLIFGDVNSELINLYRTIKGRNGSGNVLNELKKMPNDETTFYAVRSWDETPGLSKISKTKRAARFLYLNKTAFNGLYRVNSKGKFNAPFGYYDKPAFGESNLREVGKYLKQHAAGMGGGALPALGRFGCFFPEGEAFQAISSPMM